MKLELKNIKKSFEDKEVLHGVSFSVESGRALGLLGRNGAGKTTTMRIIMDVFRANEGEVILDGEKFKPDGSQVGYLPEERGLYPKKVVKEQMMYLAMLRGMNKKEALKSTTKWLEKLQVSEYTDKKLETLSKGNQQKVQLAATLVGEPEIVILDEPFSGLDPVNSQILKDVITELIAEGRIVIFSSHQMSYVEEFCEDIAIINHGDVVLAGNLDDIKEEYGKGRKIISATNYTLDELKSICEEKLADKIKVLFVSKHYVVVDVNEGVTQWQILEALKELHIDVKTFGAYEPSLNDIFVSKVGEEEVVEEAAEEEVEETPKKKSLFGRGGK
ncbi:MAG: ATP-binding cassette domain-containing protein [Lachnospiraceae bacterium]|nr:ATP-binding cassette domain-containing protein [Lachnospiraceae bacterium]